MNNNIKAILDNYEMFEDDYKKIYEYLKCMDIAYHKNDDLSKFDYENYIEQFSRFGHYAAEDIAIELYNQGKSQELIKNIIYKDIKVLSALK